MAINKKMQRASESSLKAAQKAPKIKISHSNEDLSFSELIEAKIDHESLHSNYKVRMPSSHDYSLGADNLKVSIQIEKFMNKYPKLNDLNKRKFPGPRNPEPNEQNEIKKLLDLKENRNKRKKTLRCSSACIIG